MGSSLSNREKLESIDIQNKNINLVFELRNNNIDFYRAVWWQYLINEKDGIPLKEFIEKYCPSVKMDDYETLSNVMMNRSIYDYKEFFGY